MLWHPNHSIHLKGDSHDRLPRKFGTSKPSYIGTSKPTCCKYPTTSWNKPVQLGIGWMRHQKWGLGRLFWWVLERILRASKISKNAQQFPFPSRTSKQFAYSINILTSSYFRWVVASFLHVDPFNVPTYQEDENPEGSNTRLRRPQHANGSIIASILPL